MARSVYNSLSLNGGRFIGFLGALYMFLRHRFIFTGFILFMLNLHTKIFNYIKMWSMNSSIQSQNSRTIYRDCFKDG